MNRERILALAAHIEKLPHGETEGTFNMADFTHECGSPACIAGWANALNGKGPQCSRMAANWLGLDYTWAWENLFCPKIPDEYGQWISLSTITPARAAMALRYVVSLGRYYKNIEAPYIWSEDK